MTVSTAMAVPATAMSDPRPVCLRKRAVLTMILFTIVTSGFAFTRDETLRPSAEAVTSLVKVVMTVILVVQAFFVKEILEDHLIDELKPTPIPGTTFGTVQKVSTILTFFLGIFYLQYVINRRVA